MKRTPVPSSVLAAELASPCSEPRNPFQRVRRLARPRFAKQGADQFPQTVEPAKTLVHFDEKRELAWRFLPARHDLSEKDRIVLIDTHRQAWCQRASTSGGQEA